MMLDLEKPRDAPGLNWVNKMQSETSAPVPPPVEFDEAY